MIVDKREDRFIYIFDPSPLKKTVRAIKTRNLNNKTFNFKRLKALQRVWDGSGDY